MQNDDDRPPLDPLVVEFVKALARDAARQDNRKHAEQLKQREEAETQERQRLGVGYGEEFLVEDGNTWSVYVAHALTSAEAHRLMRKHARACHPRARVDYIRSLRIDELANVGVPIGSVQVTNSSAPLKAPKPRVVQRWRKLKQREDGN
jgi:hypothetical protein